VVNLCNAGTSLYYDPGMLYGGDVEHSCNLQRSIGYYLEVLLCLAPFTKQMLRVMLTGVTSDQIDPSVSIQFFHIITQHEWGYWLVEKIDYIYKYCKFNVKKSAVTFLPVIVMPVVIVKV